MHCRRAKKLIFEFIDGLADEKVQLELEHHLGECEACEKLAMQLTRSMDLLHRAPSEKVGDNFAWKVRLGIHKEKSAMQSQSGQVRDLLRSWNLRYATSSVAGFMAVVVVGVWAFSSGALNRSDLTTAGPVVTSPPAVQGPVAMSPSLRFGSGPNASPVSASTDPVAQHTDNVRGAMDTADITSEIDSLVNHECHTASHEAHIESLRRNIQHLQAHLEACQNSAGH